jgi:hypothetical protein
MPIAVPRLRMFWPDSVARGFGESAFGHATSDCERNDDMDGIQPPNLDQLRHELDDPDPLVRQEAAIGLGDYCRKDHPAINVLIERLRSYEHTFHDRACAAWALGRIQAKSGTVVPILVALIDELTNQPEADEFRRFAVEAIENLTGELGVLVTVAQHCLRDRAWECRMKGLFIVERLIKRQPELRSAFMPLIEALVSDEVEEIRERARPLVIGFEESDYGN